jgi:hypothetical protein
MRKTLPVTVLACIAVAACSQSNLGGGPGLTPSTLDRSTVASSVNASTPTPAPTPSTTVVLAPGKVVGKNDQFTPNNGDTSSGGNGKTTDNIPCAASMTENQYHVHPYLGLYVDGTQIAIPAQIGMYKPGAPSNGYTNTASCYYYIHTHDASGMIHIEAPGTQSMASSVYTLGDVLKIWGITATTSNFGPFKGQVRVFIDRVPVKTLTDSSYTQYTGDINALPLYSHEAVWVEVGPTFVLPPNIPAVKFYTEY